MAVLASKKVDIHQAMAQFSDLLKRIALGEEVIITDAGKPVAKLVRVEAKPKQRWLGSAEGEFTVPDDFNDPLPKEIEDIFWQ